MIQRFKKIYYNKQTNMGRSFKIQYNRSKKVKAKVEKENKKTYDHISRFPEPSLGTMAEFNKNMNSPSDLWDGSVFMNGPLESHINKSGKPYDSMIIDSTGTSSYTMHVTSSSLIFTRD